MSRDKPSHTEDKSWNFVVQVDLEFNIQLLVMEVDGMREFSIQYNSNEFYKVLVSKLTYFPNSDKLGVLHGSGGRAPPMHRKNFHSGCLGRVSVMSRSCLGLVSVMSRSCLGRVSVMSRSCLGDVSVMSRSCLGRVSVMSRSCLGDVSVMSRSCLGHVSVLSR